MMQVEVGKKEFDMHVSFLFDSCSSQMGNNISMFSYLHYILIFLLMRYLLFTLCLPYIIIVHRIFSLQYICVCQARNIYIYIYRQGKSNKLFYQPHHKTCIFFGKTRQNIHSVSFIWMWWKTSFEKCFCFFNV